MSRSQPTQTNPALYFYSWSGSRGQLEHYDKERKLNIPVTMPFSCMVLDELATITGYCEPDESSYWSNEVRSVAKEELTVKTSKGTRQVGLYANLADVRAKGAKYAKSIYIATKINDEYVIANIKASGAALTSWIELSQAHKVANGTIMLTGKLEAKKGTNTYYMPVFDYRASTPDEDEIAIALDKQLQVYLSQYLAKPVEDDMPVLNNETHTSKPDMSDITNQSSARTRSQDEMDAEAQSLYASHATAESMGAPFDVNDIPFE